MASNVLAQKQRLPSCDPNGALLRANANCQGLQLGEILLRHLPQLFTPKMEDAFFAMLEEETMTDANLRDSVVDFLSPKKWRQRRLASYPELLADSAVEREMSVCLPKAVPMWRWITRRLAGGIDITDEETGSWTLHLVPDCLATTAR